jgi:DNA gyrase subunit A
MVFTSKGQVFLLPVWQVPEGGRAARGTPIVNLLPHVGKDEKVATVISIREFDERSLVLVTRSGMIKRSKLSAYRNIRASGIIACSLKDSDEVLSVRLLDDPDGSLLLATAQGKSIHFDAIQAREMGRTARGVIGIRMGGDDELVGIEVVRPNVTLLTLTTNGYGKRTAIGEYRKQNRGGMGLIDIKTEGRNGHVVGVTQVEDNEQIMIVTSGGKIIRTGVHEVSVIGRNTMGVRLIRLDKDEKVVSFARLGEREDDEDLFDEDGELLVQQEDSETASAETAAVDDELGSEAAEVTEDQGDDEVDEEDETVRLED